MAVNTPAILIDKKVDTVDKEVIVNFHGHIVIVFLLKVKIVQVTCIVAAGHTVLVVKIEANTFEVVARRMAGINV